MSFSNCNKNVWIVLRNKDRREFRRVFNSLKGAKDYILAGKKSGIEGANSEFIERHEPRKS